MKLPTRPRLTPWPGPGKPDEAFILDQLAGQGLGEARLWSNAPFDSYPSHEHDYHKVLYVLFGSITFGVGERKFTLKAGDRLDLPPGVVHDALVGEAGVVCLEAQA
ncbi:MAG TPA: cupin domain-containing protein [Anaerolineales bacterium]|nr:cupin domain-containing protein [Anaerolineales bacterium]